MEKFEDLLGAGDEAAVKKELLALTVSEIARVINQVQRGKRKLFVLLPPEVQAEILNFLNRKSKKTILPRLGNLLTARFLRFVNSDGDACDILRFLPEKRQEEIIKSLPRVRAAALQKLLKYSPEVAGGIMDYNFIIVSHELTFREVKEKMEVREKEFKQIPAVVAQDENKKIVGYLPLQKIIFADPESKIKKFVRNLTLVSDAEDEAELVKHIQSGAQILGVVNGNENFAGVIKIEDLAKLSLKEATENIYGFAGVGKEEDIFDSPLTSIKRRSRWLLLNLGTAFLAAAVVSLFQDTIGKFVLLAAYMPVVAGMGGNAATQTLAITVRAIALGDATLKNSAAILKKEILTSLGNGLLVGLTAGAISYALNYNPVLGFVLFSALAINLIVAGFFGSVIPLFLKFLKIDPALSAAVFITTATDIFGFLAFLGLAKIFLA